MCNDRNRVENGAGKGKAGKEKMGEELFADIIIDISHEALDKVFQYRGAFFPAWRSHAGSPGLCAFRARETVSGRDMSLQSQSRQNMTGIRIKEILRISEGSLTVESQLIQVAAFLKKRYGSSMLQALKTVMPVKTKVRHRQEVTLYLKLERAEAEGTSCRVGKKAPHGAGAFFTTAP